MWSLKRARVVGIAGIIGVVGCGSSSTGPSPESLTGTWNATQAQIVDINNNANRVDLVTMGGTLQLVLDAGGTWTMTISMPGVLDDDVRWGNWTSTDVLTLSFDPACGYYGEMQFDATLNGNTLTLTGGHTPYDFNGDGIANEEGIMTLILVR